MKTPSQQSQNEFISQLQAKVSMHLGQAISTYQNLSESQLNEPSNQGGWSIAQCLAHLNTYAAYYLPLIQKAIDSYTGQPSKQVVKGWLGKYFTSMIDPDQQSSTYKAAKIHLPPSQLDPYQTVAQFIQYQEELLELLRQAEIVNLNTIRIPISIARLIRIRLGDTLCFLTTHNERHIRQANRNLSKQDIDRGDRQ